MQLPQIAHSWVILILLYQIDLFKLDESIIFKCTIITMAS